MSEPSKGPRPSDKWIPWYFVAFFVGLTFLLSFFVYLSLRDFPGTVSDKAYEQGLAYNQTLQATTKQKELGWNGVVTVTPEGAQVRVRYEIKQAEGVLIKDAQVHGWFYRPTNSKLDQKFDLQAQPDGSYQAVVTLPVSGVWDIRLATQADGHDFQQSERVVLP